VVNDADVHVCDFCGKNTRQVTHMIKGPEDGSADGLNICDECIVLCVEILREYNHPAMNARIEEALLRAAGTDAEIEPQARHCFYVGPFREPFDTIYASRVKPTVAGLGCSIIRADEIFGTGVIIDDVRDGIAAAELVIADLTGKNPNVMYEIGMAHTMGRPVLMLSQYPDDIPFDLRHRRAIIYDHTPHGLAAMTEALAQTLASLFAIDLASPTA